jgi:hypothetical protein
MVEATPEILAITAVHPLHMEGEEHCVIYDDRLRACADGCGASAEVAWNRKLQIRAPEMGCQMLAIAYIFVGDDNIERFFR